MSALLTSPSADDFIDIEIIWAHLPLVAKVDVIANRCRVGPVELQPYGQGHRFAKYKGFASSQSIQDTDQIAFAFRYETSDVTLIVGVRDAKADERATLASRPKDWSCAIRGEILT